MIKSKYLITTHFRKDPLLKVEFFIYTNKSTVILKKSYKFIKNLQKRNKSGIFDNFYQLDIQKIEC